MPHCGVFLSHTFWKVITGNGSVCVCFCCCCLFFCVFFILCSAFFLSVFVVVVLFYYYFMTPIRYIWGAKTEFAYSNMKTQYNSETFMDSRHIMQVQSKKSKIFLKTYPKWEKKVVLSLSYTELGYKKLISKYFPIPEFRI